MITVAATGNVFVSVIDLTALVPQLDTAETLKVNVVGITGYFMEILLESVAFTLNKTAPAGKVQ